MMEQDEFIEEVQQNLLRNHAIHISREEAFKAIHATLETLGEYLVNLTTLSSYLPPAVATDVCTQLPEQLAPLLDCHEGLEARST